MKIERVINGETVTIELTAHELWKAYREQEHKFDKEDVISWLDVMDDPPELTDEQIDDAAMLARDWMEYNDGIAECRWNCIESAIKEVSE